MSDEDPCPATLFIYYLNMWCIYDPHTTKAINYLCFSFCIIFGLVLIGQIKKAKLAIKLTVEPSKF